jgi:DNA-binding HxlR family transcriptional regulator
MRDEGWNGPPYPKPPMVPLKACPIATSLQFLGRKWTLTILRDVAFIPRTTFSQIQKGNPGLKQRTLSLRLRELSSEGLVRRVVPTDAPRHPYYELTPKGLEIWPVLAALFEFGIRNHASTVFEDGQVRDLTEMQPRDADLLLGPLIGYARGAGGVGASAGPKRPAP